MERFCQQESGKTMQKIIDVKDGITRMPAWRMAEPVNFTLGENEHIAITGPNGGGKSMLVDIITGNHPLVGDSIEYDFFPSTKELVSENIKYITFRDSYGVNDNTYYLQQRWNHHDIDNDTPTVGEVLNKEYILTGKDTQARQEFRNYLYKLFCIEHLLDKYVILLSSGETRKFQLIRTLLSEPRVLIMDNPFIGLDADTRIQLEELLSALVKETNMQIIIVVSKSDDIPSFITHIVEVCNMTVGRKTKRNEYICNIKPTKAEDYDISKEIIALQQDSHIPQSDIVIRMTDVCVSYGERCILKNINWTVRKGENWIITGQNGAGKSTLLSIICADNPQGYACDIELFGVRRGTGESIWDIKKNIGYVSPEMHRAYKRNIEAIKIVASGLKDTVGLYYSPNEKEYERCLFWMRMFGIEKYAGKTFMNLSSGEQRLVLLARAFVKDPSLLILDEPFHGLDIENRNKVRGIIESFSKRKDKTILMVSHYKEEFPDCMTNILSLKRHI